MTQYLNSRILDFGLNVLVVETTRIVALSAAPTDYASLAGLTIGHKDAPVVVGPATSGGGRKVTVNAISDGVIDVNGTVSYWALVDDRIELILAYGQFAVAKAFTTVEDFATGDFDITLPGLVP